MEQSSIPKIIHYVWFGGKPLTPLAEKCIESWQKNCPDYEIKRWDESNFNSGENRYFIEAIEAKKWAFASDYARLKVLVDFGGIYMDTDVEVLKPLDSFLVEEAFSGFEAAESVPTGLMASRAGMPFFERLLRDYDDRHFILEDGSLDLTTNVTLITNACTDAGLILNGQKQTVAGFTLYPKEYFCPKDHDTGRIHLTSNSYAIHHFDGSWLPPEYSLYQKEKKCLISRYPAMPVGIAKGLALVRSCFKDKSLKPYMYWRNHRS